MIAPFSHTLCNEEGSSVHWPFLFHQSPPFHSCKLVKKHRGLPIKARPGLRIIFVNVQSSIAKITLSK
ncbi:hypothetical protein Bca4012_097895 [Brassica carinata]